MRAIEATMRVATGGMLLLMLIFGLANIAMRWVGDTGLIWYNDLARFGLVWATMTGAVLVSMAGEHLVVNDTLVGRFPPALARVATAVRIAATGLFLCVVLFEGTRLTIQAAQQGFVTVRWLPLAVGYAALPVGAALMLAALGADVLRRSRPGRAGAP
jgi:TRAP-type C4-dicarboxylate transport system permease small subunit